MALLIVKEFAHTIIVPYNRVVEGTPKETTDMKLNSDMGLGNIKLDGETSVPLVLDANSVTDVKVGS